MEEQENSIETIFVRPRNKFYVEYIVNESSKHTKTYDQIKKYLKEIIPERTSQFNYALSKFLSFIIIVPEKEFIFLQLNDMKEHYDDLKEMTINPTVEDAMESIKDQNALSIDDKLKKISELII